jgi:hypothetical protein
LWGASSGIALWAFSGSDDEQVAELPNRSMPQAAPVTPPRSTTGSRSTNASRPQPRPQSTANSSTTSSNHFGRPPQSNTATGSGGSVTSDPLGASTASGSLSHGASGDVEPIADVPALSAGASVDSLPAELKVELPSSQLVSIPMPPRSLAFYSHCTSPFLAIVSQDKKEGQLWDLRSLEQSASFQPAMEWASSKATLSPDGRYFASFQHDTVSLKPLDEKAEPRKFKLSAPIYLLAVANERLVCIAQYRDPETRKSEPTVHVFDVKSGEVTGQFGFDGAPANPMRSFAVSPGLKLLAAIVNKDRQLQLQLIETETGKLVADCQLPRVAGGLLPTGLAFSPAGDELTIMARRFQGGATTLLTWQVPDGKFASQVMLSHADYSWLTRDGAIAGPVIEPLADGAGWILCGRGIVDRAGHVTQELPEGTFTDRSIPRRGFGVDSFLVGAHSGNGLTLTNRVEQSAQSASTDPAQPAMNSVRFDLSKAKQIELPSGTVKWEVKLDPAATAKSGLGAKPIELKSVGDEPVSYHFASPATGIVAIYCMKAKTHADIVAENEARAAQVQAESRRIQAGIPGSGVTAGNQRNRIIPTPPVWIDRYDLAAGEYLGRLNLAKGSVMHDVSPDGVRALVQYGDDLQVWSLADGKQIAQWTVPSLGAGNKGFATSCLFSDNDHVMARVDKERVARWHLPDCTPTYVVEKLQSLSGTSVENMTPGRKYWITLLQKTGSPAVIGFIETATGQLRGVASAGSGGSDFTTLNSIHPRPDGQQTALKLMGGSSQLRTIVDMNTGRIYSEPSDDGGVVWAGNRHFFSRGKLYDLAYRHEVWSYSLPHGTLAVAEAADGGLWFSTRAGAGETPRWLALATIPAPATIKQIDAMFAGKKPLVDKGSKVSLEVSCDGPGDMNGKVTAELTKELKARGIGVAEGQPVRLVVEARVTDTSTKEFKSIGVNRGGPETINFNVSVVTCNVRFVANGDKTIWQTSSKHSSDPGFIVTGDISKQEQSHWPKAERWLMAIPVPSRVYPPPEKIGSSTLQFPGVVDTSPQPLAGRQQPSDTASVRPAVPRDFPQRPNFPGAAAQPTADVGSASEREHREHVAKAYADIVEKQAFDKLRTVAKLGQPLVGIRWALGTETTTDTAKRDIDNFSSYSGKAILDGLAARSERREFGDFPVAGNAALQRPALLGAGTRTKLLNAARRHWADMLLIADIDTKRIGLTGRTDSSATVRIFDVATGEQLWASEPLKQFNFSIGKQFADYVLKHVADSYLLKPAAPTAASVAGRSEQLGKKQFVHPLGAIVEVDFYRHKELLTQEAATKQYETILGIVDGRKYAEADAQQRKELIDQWLPNWLAEE